MKKALNVKTYENLAFVDGGPLFEDCSDILLVLVGIHRTGKIELSNTPIDGYTKAATIGHIGNTTQYRSKDGIFTVCNSHIVKHQMGKQFYYKVNKT
jgi:hypothetical protein